jgi:cytochrome c-type biogenesis protein CcmH/NrfG
VIACLYLHWKEEMMGAEKPRSDEALALERVAAAAREVQAASTALQTHFAGDGGRQPSMLELARFAAAMQELKDAREAFDRLIVGDTDR